MLEFLAMGLILGLSSGLSPGPVLTLVIAETLRHGIGAGVRVAVAPLLTDLPIILASLLVLAQFSDARAVLGCISLAGAGFMFYLAYENLNTTGLPADLGTQTPAALTRGALANILNPAPYLFWFSIGAPLTTRAMGLGIGAAALFLVGFYGCLVGSKVLLAVLVGRSRGVLTDRWLVRVFRVLGLLLTLLALTLLWDGLVLLGAVPG